MVNNDKQAGLGKYATGTAGFAATSSITTEWLRIAKSPFSAIGGLAAGTVMGAMGYAVGARSEKQFNENQKAIAELKSDNASLKHQVEALSSHHDGKGVHSASQEADTDISR